MKYIGWDIEIAKEVPEGENWKQHRPLGITCASAVAEDLEIVWYAGKYENKFNPMMNLTEIQSMVKSLQGAVADGYKLVTWNGLSFDFDVAAEESQMKAECVDLALNHIDIMYQFFCLKGFPVGINAVAKGSKLPEKLEGMHGDLAPVMWRDGNCQAVIDYNIRDSRMALNIANFAENTKFLYWITQKGLMKSAYISKLLTVKECESIPSADQSWMTKPLSREDYLKWTIG